MFSIYARWKMRGFWVGFFEEFGWVVLFLFFFGRILASLAHHISK